MIIKIVFILQFFLYVFVSVLITYLLYRKGRFNDVRKIEHPILTAAGLVIIALEKIVNWLAKWIV